MRITITVPDVPNLTRGYLRDAVNMAISEYLEARVGDRTAAEYVAERYASHDESFRTDKLVYVQAVTDALKASELHVPPHWTCEPGRGIALNGVVAVNLTCAKGTVPAYADDLARRIADLLNEDDDK